MARYLVQRLGPSATYPTVLIERCGDNWASFEDYANVHNVIRYGLAKDKYPAGTYHIYLWPRGSSRSSKPTVAYKRV